MKYPMNRMQNYYVLLGFVIIVMIHNMGFSEDNQGGEKTKNRKKKIIHLEEITITATRTEKDVFHTPNTISLINDTELHERLMARTIPESLKRLPGVWVQKTAHGQGSPYIRGFTGYQTLFMIDGIRLNNSTFRSGPNQYWNTVDTSSIERIEIVKGPGSVLYGSDAIGGTVNAITKSMKDYSKGFLWTPLLSYRYASAENSNIGRVEFSGSKDEKFGFLVGGSIKRFGDVDGGRNVGLQKNTGYDEIDGDFKLEYFLNQDSKIILVHQRVDQDNAWRTHKTTSGISWAGTTVGNEKKRALDQNRELTYIQYHGKNITSFLDDLKVSLSYHSQEEERFRIKKDDSQELQGVDVKTPGFWTQAETKSSFGNWTYGLEYYHDFVDSFKNKYKADGSLKSVEIQGPVADDASYDTLGIFIQNDIHILDSLELILGVRYTYAKADANKFEDPFSGDESSLSDNWNSFVGSLRTLYHIDKAGHWNLFAGLSQGFRAPNLSDLTRLDTGRSNEIETPSPNLNPEKYLTAEIGFRTKYDSASAQMSYFYTLIDEMIIRTPTGNTIDGDNEVTKENVGDGFVHGIELNADYQFYPQFTTFGAFTWIYGEVDTYPTSDREKVREPLDRLMPLTLNMGIRWKHPKEKCWIELSSQMAADAHKLSTRDKSDTQRIPPGGTPGYAIFHIRSGWEFRRNMMASAAVENITNRDYRIHGSGLNEPGTNFVLRLNTKF